jgi:hypothetical protein
MTTILTHLADPAQLDGPAWITQDTGQSLSPLGLRVAHLLNLLCDGIYHIARSVRRVDWSDPICITVLLRHRDLATWDHDALTQLVFLAHALAVRAEVTAAAPNTLRLQFHARAHEPVAHHRRHPTLDQAVARFNAMYGERLALVSLQEKA